MHSPVTVETALRLAGTGAKATDIARQLAIARRTISDWLRGAIPRRIDRHTSVRRVGLRLSLDTRYPEIIEQCVKAIGEVMPSNRVVASRTAPGS